VYKDMEVKQGRASRPTQKDVEQGSCASREAKLSEGEKSGGWAHSSIEHGVMPMERRGPAKGILSKEREAGAG
jgi:hypothetical protein